MEVCICLLRGINVNGKRLVKMGNLKKVLLKAGYAEVTTYIQSGNLVLKAPAESKASLAARLENILGGNFGFEIPVLLYSPLEWRTVLEANPFIPVQEDDTKSLYYIFWKTPPPKDLPARLTAANLTTEQWAIGKYCLYLKCNKGYGRSRLDNNFFERLAGVQASTRNHRTLLKLADLADGQGA